MSFFAGVIFNRPKMNNYKVTNEIIFKKEGLDLIIDDEKLIENNNVENKEEDAPRINENEIKDNNENIKIDNTDQNNEGYEIDNGKDIDKRT